MSGSGGTITGGLDDDVCTDLGDNTITYSGTQACESCFGPDGAQSCFPVPTTTAEKTECLRGGGIWTGLDDDFCAPAARTMTRLSSRRRRRRRSVVVVVSLSRSRRGVVVAASSSWCRCHEVVAASSSRRRRRR